MVQEIHKCKISEVLMQVETSPDKLFLVVLTSSCVSIPARYLVKYSALVLNRSVV